MFDPEVPFNTLPFLTSKNFAETKELRKLAEDTRVAIEVLNYAVNALPSPQILIDTLALQEAKVSSDIENIVTTNDELYMGVMFDEFVPAAKEVVNYKQALFAGFSCLQEKGIVSLSDIEAINEPVNTRQCGIRTNLPNFSSDLTRIANRRADGAVEIIYTPPHGRELLQRLLIDMLEFIYDDEAYALHPLIKIAMAHYQFESIHPFRDGNGRTGRILNTLFLCQKGYLSQPILYGSSYIIRTKNQYYDLLLTANQTGNCLPVAEYLLQSFKSTATRTLQIVEQIRSLLFEYSSDVFLSGITGQKELLQQIVLMIFKKVYVRISDLVELGLHRQTASTYLKQFADRGLLVEEKAGRHKYFKNIKLLKLFEGD